MCFLSLPAPYVLTDRRALLATRLGALPYRERPLDGILGVAVHATAEDTNAESLSLYQTTKIEGDPYPAIAYHFVVCRDGTVEWCHDLATETWHAGSPGSRTHI